MKIDYSNITHNAFLLIDDMTSTLYDCMEKSDDNDNYRLEMLGEIRGVIAMSKAMMDVLKS